MKSNFVFEHLVPPLLTRSNKVKRLKTVKYHQTSRLTDLSLVWPRMKIITCFSLLLFLPRLWRRWYKNSARVIFLTGCLWHQLVEEERKTARRRRGIIMILVIFSWCLVSSLSLFRWFCLQKYHLFPLSLPPLLSSHSQTWTDRFLRGYFHISTLPLPPMHKTTQ